MKKKCPKCGRDLEMNEYVDAGGGFYYCEHCVKAWKKEEVEYGV